MDTGCSRIASFAQELKYLRNQSKTSPPANVRNLGLYIDADGLSKSKGRLNNAPILPSEKRPILLPSKHYFTNLVIRQVHQEVMHSGINHTLSMFRERFWILRGRETVKRILKECVVCLRHQARACSPQPTPDLPRIRVDDAPPFANTGLDFLGPLYITEGKHSDENTSSKVYVCLYTFGSSSSYKILLSFTMFITYITYPSIGQSCRLNFSKHNTKDMNSSTIANVLYRNFNVKKNKLIWSGSLEDLKALVLTEVDEDTAQSITWRSPSGGKWSFESKVLTITWHSRSEYIYFGGEKGNELSERVQSSLEQGDNAFIDNGTNDESQLRKSLESLLTDDSDDASFIDDTSQNSPSRIDECEVTKKLTNQHGKHGEATSNPKSSKYEVEESVTETISTDNLHKESLNLHTPPKSDKTTSTENPNKESLLHTAPKPVGNLRSSYDHDIEINLLKSKLDRFAENVSTKLDDLALEINHIKENKPYSIVILEDQIMP